MNHDDRIGRWKTCLHEAGHVVAAIGFGATGRSVLSENGGGLTDVTSDLPPSVVVAAIYAAAGRCGEKLADDWPPPAVDAAELPSQTAMLPTPASPEQSAAIMAILTDSQFVDLCAEKIGLPSSLFGLWRQFVKKCADELVSQHELEIVNNAMHIFRDGRAVVAPAISQSAAAAAEKS
jgi:hypothetical protein